MASYDKSIVPPANALRYRIHIHHNNSIQGAKWHPLQKDYLFLVGVVVSAGTSMVLKLSPSRLHSSALLSSRNWALHLFSFNGVFGEGEDDDESEDPSKSSRSPCSIRLVLVLVLVLEGYAAGGDDGLGR
jgi:hypothetical protein